MYYITFNKSRLNFDLVPCQSSNRFSGGTARGDWGEVGSGYVTGGNFQIHTRLLNLSSED